MPDDLQTVSSCVHNGTKYGILDFTIEESFVNAESRLNHINMPYYIEGLARFGENKGKLTVRNFFSLTGCVHFFLHRYLRQAPSQMIYFFPPSICHSCNASSFSIAIAKY